MTMQRMQGSAASGGLAVGPAYVVADDGPSEIPVIANPAKAFDDAVAAAVASLVESKEKAAADGRDDAADILSAQMLMAEDPMLVDEVKQRITAGDELGTALYEVGDNLAEMLASMEDEYLAARSSDVREVVNRIGRALAGESLSDEVDLTEPSVVIATELTAATTASLDTSMVLGFATEQGGPTSHVAVIARSLGIPAVVGLKGLIEAAAEATSVAMDGGKGELIFDPEESVVAEFEERRVLLDKRKALEAEYRGRSVAFDERAITIAANVGNAEDVAKAGDAVADGIGLFRTEFLFLERADAPTEEEQYAEYRAAVERFDHPVVIRTFDIGGDKPAPYLTIEPEENPFLGVRGVRLYESASDLFASQIRAALRASAHGDLWLMIPMVATVDDAAEVRKAIEVLRAGLEEEGVEYGTPKVGVMIEVPSAALIASQLAKVVDFFSIGTNDLTQYTLAVDRTSGVLAHYSDAAHPSVLRLCYMTAMAADAADIPVAVCGEAGADPVTATLFMAMGMGKLSVAPSSIDATRALIDRLDVAAVTDVLPKALAAGSAAEVRALVESILP